MVMLGCGPAYVVPYVIYAIEDVYKNVDFTM